MKPYVYNLTKQLIKLGGDKDDITQNLAVFLAFNQITVEQYEELMLMLEPETEVTEDDGEI